MRYKYIDALLTYKNKYFLLSIGSSEFFSSLHISGEKLYTQNVDISK